jgi:TDG/mug DNA glycosylase family protein
MIQSRKPTSAEIQAAEGKTVPDIIAPNLRVLFCGINPGLYSGAVGHHFARPGNRFWPALYNAGFTDRILDPSEERELLRYGYGITNVVERATSGENDLTKEEIVAGGERLVAKVKKFRPRVLAVLGIGAYRKAFERRKARVGPQPEQIGDTDLWVLPNPSGLNAHYQLEDLARVYGELRTAVSG